MKILSFLNETKNWYRFVVLAVLLLSLQYVYASNDTGAKLTPTNYVDISGVETLHDGSPALSFVVNATCDGSYIPSFLLNVNSVPKGGKGNVYDLIVNEKRVGELTTEESGLQILQPDEPKEIELKSGENNIKIVSRTFQYPNVIALRLSVSEYESLALSNVLEEIEDVTESNGEPELHREATSVVKPKNVFNISPSYCSILYLEKGNLLNIMFHASMPCIVDLVCLTGSINEKEHMSVSAISTYDIIEIENYCKYKNQICTTFPITSSGQYVLTLRPVIKMTHGLFSGQINVYNKIGNNFVKIEDLVLGEDLEFYSNQIDLEIPSDGSIHKVYAKGGNPSTTDLIMFVYGGLSNKKHIVGCNDNDVTGTYLNYGGTSKDACINMSPSRKTSFIRLLNKGAAATTAFIYSDLLFNLSTGTFSANNTGNSCAPSIKSCDLQLGSTCDFNEAKVSDLYISDINGLIVSERHFSEPCESVSLSELGISKSGRYIFTMVSESNQTNSQQVRIK